MTQYTFRELTNGTQQSSKTEVSLALEDICTELPIAKSLSELFISTADQSSLRIEDKNKIFARVKNPNINLFMLFTYKHGYAYLTVYDPQLAQMPAPESNVLCAEYASIFAGAIDTGVWTSCYGNQKRYEIRVHLPATINLPSPKGKWFFDLMARFALRSSEFHLNISEQPKF
jgi:hypothetical protein